MASYTYTPVPDTGAKAGVLAYLVVSAVVLLLMMVFGLLMRLEQAQMISIGGLWFYKIMTLHGAGMVGIVALAGAAIMWHFLRLYVDLSSGIFMANLALFLTGVVMILASVLLGDFHAGWTFLFPLPGNSMGLWSTGAAALFMGGLLVIGVGSCCCIWISRAPSSFVTAASAAGSGGPSFLVLTMVTRHHRPSSPAQW